MQTYNDAVVIDVHPDNGQIDLLWFNGDTDAQGSLLTPINQQRTWRMSHRVPLEAEENNWTREQLIAFLSAEVPDVADIPQWATDEVGRYTIEYRERVRISQ